MTLTRVRAARVEARPQSVGEVVRRVRASLRATRGVESALFFVSGALCAWSAGLWSGAEGRGLLVLALLCGALAAASWWLEHPLEPAALARSLDERLQHDGALVTALELEELGSRRELAALEELVRERVLVRLRPREALRALFPSLFLPLSAPVLSALAWILVLDARRAAPADAVDFASLAQGFERALALGSEEPAAGRAGEDAAQRLSPEQRRALDSVLALGKTLPQTDAEWRQDPAAARATVAAAEQELGALAARLEPEGRLRRHLEEAQAWLDALRVGLEPERGERAAAGTSPDLTNGSRDGTISRSSSSPIGTATAPDSPATVAVLPPASLSTAPLGVQAGSFWPPEYDAVVERWIELSRAAHPDRGE